MYNQKKRPTTSKPFNPAHTHPASISSTPSIQTRQHASSSSSAKSSSSDNAKTPVPAEGIQSGGGGGGGAGAGSIEGIEGEDNLGKEASKNDESDGKWSDPKKVHPAWEGWGKGPNKEEEEKDKKRDGKAKL